MKIFNIVKHSSIFRKLPLYLYHTYHNRRKVRFWYCSDIAKKSQFEGKNMVCKHARFVGKMGFGSYVGPHSNICADIGRFTSIAGNCNYIAETHPMKSPFATTSPYFYSLDCHKNPENETFAKKQFVEEYLYYDKGREIVNKIGNDCWLGANVTLVGGIEIADGAVVLAHAVVTKNVPPYAIVGGIPAKIIGYRYDEKTIEFLLRTKWWSNNKEWFLEHADLLVDIDKMKKYFGDAE